MKTINLTQNAVEAVNYVKNVIETVKNQLIFCGIKEIINTFKNTTDVNKLLILILLRKMIYKKLLIIILISSLC